jgi:hypothetical protein
MNGSHRAFGAFERGTFRALNESQFRGLVAAYKLAHFHSLNLSRCVVVASSSSALATPRGAWIDEHSAVIRVNGYQHAPELNGFLGRRTDLRVLAYSKHFQNLSRTAIISCWWGSNCWSAAADDRVPRLSPWIVRRAKQSAQTTKWPSTGFLSVIFAQTVCDRVNVVGFGINRSFSNCTHYYNVNTTNASRCVLPTKTYYRNSCSGYERYAATNAHDFAAEARAIRQIEGFAASRR